MSRKGPVLQIAAISGKCLTSQLSVLVSSMLFGVLLTSFGIILIIYRPVGIYYCFLIFILIGLILLLISNIALRGISKESIALLIIYLAVLIIPASLEIVLFFLHRRYELSMLSYFKWLFDRYGVDGFTTEIVDIVQMLFRCCGFNGPDSMHINNGTYALSCCSKLTGVCERPFDSTCSSVLEKYHIMINKGFSEFFVFFSCIQVPCVIATIYLILYLTRYKTRKNVTQYSKF